MGNITCKMTFKTSAGGKNYSWTEQHTWNTATTADTVVARANTLAYNRSQLLGPGIIMDAPVLYDDALFGDSTLCFTPTPVFIYNVPLYNYDYAPLVAGVRSLGFFPDFPYSDLLLRKNSGTLYHASGFIAGLPDQNQNTDFATLSGPGSGRLTTTLNLYIAELIAHWGFLAWNSDIDVVPRQRIINVTTDALGSYFTTDGAHNIPATGARVLIGAGRLSYIGGNGRVISSRGVLPTGYVWVNATGADTFAVPGWVRNWNNGLPPLPFAYRENTGYVHRLVTTIAPYTSISINGFVRHKRGSSAGAPRGRRGRSSAIRINL